MRAPPVQRAYRFISFEVNLPEFAPEGLECIEILAGLDGNGRFNYATGDYEQGLALNQWSDAPEFARALEACTEKNIEVFWKAPPVG